MTTNWRTSRLQDIGATQKSLFGEDLNAMLRPKSILFVTGLFIQPIRFLIFNQMKMSGCEPFSKGSLHIELRPM